MFLLRAAARCVKRAAAVTVRSGFLTPEEYSFASASASEAGIPFYSIDVDMFSEEKIVSNPPDRCYHCKKLIFKKVKALAEREGFEVVLEGTNADDIYDHRPGMKAVREAGVLSPLLEAGLTKDEIRTLSEAEGIKGAYRPPNSCLATRVPAGDRITYTALTMIAGAERAIKKIGIDNVRVRCDRDNARIEVDRNGISILLDEGYHDTVVRGLKSLGFKTVAVDLEGYKNPVYYKENY